MNLQANIEEEQMIHEYQLIDYYEQEELKQLEQEDLE